MNTPLERSILAVLRASPALSTREIARAVECNATYTREVLTRLTDEGAVSRLGTGARTTWLLWRALSIVEVA